VAVCCLTSRDLVPVLGHLSGVAAVGTLMTANLGIEELICALRARPQIRTLVVCGKDSPRFRAGQSLVALFRHGLEPERRLIRGADGYLPVLPSMSAGEVDAVRVRVELVDARGECDPQVLRALIGSLAHRPAGQRPAPASAPDRPAHRGFRRLRPGGRRAGLLAAIDGFVVITLDHAAHRIRLRHYDRELTPCHEMYGRRAESMLLGVLRAGVISEPDHAGYLGAELAKAETALRLGLPYEQDLPLRAGTRLPAAESPAAAGKGRCTMSEPLTLEEFLGVVTETLGAQDVQLDPDLPIGAQLSVESARMIELAIILEEELGLDLPDDVDLRQETGAGLHAALLAGSRPAR